jgi:hypothetical protein
MKKYLASQSNDHYPIQDVIFRIELAIAFARGDISALEEDLQFETEEKTRLAKLDDGRLFDKREKIYKINAELIKMDYYVRGLRTALSFAKNDD